MTTDEPPTNPLPYAGIYVALAQSGQGSTTRALTLVTSSDVWIEYLRVSDVRAGPFIAQVVTIEHGAPIDIQVTNNGNVMTTTPTATDGRALTFQCVCEPGVVSVNFRMQTVPEAVTS